MVDYLYMDESKKLLKKILEITDFQGDKDAFIEMLTNLIFEDAVKSLLGTLPKARHAGAVKKWAANVENPAALTSILKHYFTKEQINKAMQEASTKAIAGYLSSIDSKLNNEKRRQLFKLSQQLPAE
jgi:hypothetical protein